MLILFIISTLINIPNTIHNFNPIQYPNFNIAHSTNPLSFHNSTGHTLSASFSTVHILRMVHIDTFEPTRWPQQPILRLWLLNSADPVYHATSTTWCI